jgi:ABC-2 type transport system permease protein
VKYVAIGRAQVLATLMYNRDVLVRSIFMVVIMVTFVQLWSATFATTGQSVVNGFTVRDLVWYLVITEVVALSTPRIAQTVDQQVRTGDIAYQLARPYSFPLFHLASYWGETLVRAPVNLLVGSCVALVAVGPPALSPVSAVATLMLWAGAITLRASMDILVGLSAFWVEDTVPLQWITGKFLITIGGLILPLDLFPDWLATISRALPFAAIMYAPARAFVGSSWDVVTPLVLIQGVWLVICWLGVWLVFARAARRLVAHGG